jgi:hypothetical protein
VPQKEYSAWLTNNLEVPQNESGSRDVVPGSLVVVGGVVVIVMPTTNGATNGQKLRVPM